MRQRFFVGQEGRDNALQFFERRSLAQHGNAFALTGGRRHATQRALRAKAKLLRHAVAATIVAMTKNRPQGSHQGGHVICAQLRRQGGEPRRIRGGRDSRAWRHHCSQMRVQPISEDRAEDCDTQCTTQGPEQGRSRGGDTEMFEVHAVLRRQHNTCITMPRPKPSTRASTESARRDDRPRGATAIKRPIVMMAVPAIGNGL